MKITRMNKQKGITLIALVITIIVLLILAGVAISMLSGENGILTRASEAKTQTEESQKQEEVRLIDYELETHFILNNSKYRCSNGYITGVTVGKDKILDLEKELPEGYQVKYKFGYNNGGEDIEIAEEEKVGDNAIYLATGMGIVKSDSDDIIARVVIFGDIDCEGQVNSSDGSEILMYISGKSSYLKEFSIVAMDVNHDGFIGDMDENIILKCASTKDNINNYQDSDTLDVNSLMKKDTIETIKDYINTLEVKNDSYKWTEGSSTMYLKGVTSDTTGDDVLANIGLTGKAYVCRYIEDDDEEITITTQTVQSGDEIILIEPYCKYGNKVTTLAIIRCIDK